MTISQWRNVQSHSLSPLSPHIKSPLAASNITLHSTSSHQQSFCWKQRLLSAFWHTFITSITFITFINFITSITCIAFSLYQLWHFLPFTIYQFNFHTKYEPFMQLHAGAFTWHSHFLRSKEYPLNIPAEK